MFVLPLARWAALFCLLYLSATQAFAQAPPESLNEEFSYEMQLEDGTNATAVAWNGSKGHYLAVIAGNATFPLEIFDGSGKAIVQDEAGNDWRGLWYDEGSKSYVGNGAGESGWVKFTLDGQNRPSDITLLKEGQNQPDFQSVGAYDASKKQVVFLDYAVDGLSMYSIKNPKKIKHLNLDWSNSEIGNVNSTTVGYTGHKGFEFVLLDYNLGNLVFFDRTGNQTGMSKLPEDAPLNDAFAFSFTNDRAFLYDKEGRVWHAYKVW